MITKPLYQISENVLKEIEAEPEDLDYQSCMESKERIGNTGGGVMAGKLRSQRGRGREDWDSNCLRLGELPCPGRVTV